MRAPTLTIAALAVATLASACASHTRIPEPLRQQISARHAGETVALRQSCYFGDLYDDNEKWLLSPYPFAEVFHIVDTKGEPIHPQNQRGIVPAGTTFVIERVEFPDAAAMRSRMLTTPRFHTWVYLTPTAENTKIPSERRFSIVLLPMDLQSEEGVEESLRRLVGPPEEVSRWLEGLRPTVRVAVEHKDVIEGMSLAESTASMGEPQRWFHDNGAEGPVDVAWYPSRELWLRGDKVIAIKEARTAEPVPERTTAPSEANPAP